MLTGTQAAFLCCLTNYLCGCKSTVSFEIDKAEVINISKQHQCNSIVYSQTRLPELRNAAMNEMYFGAKRRSQLGKIHDAFSSAGIDYILFKGTEVAQYYPQPFYRTMGDSDILVHSEDKEYAGNVLQTLGMTIQSHDGGEWVYNWNGLSYELHSQMMNDEAGNLSTHKRFMSEHWKNAWKHVDTQYRLDDSFHFVFLILHLRKHFINSGVGFRQFMDITVMQQKGDLHWDWIEEKLVELGIEDFAKICFALCQRWFDVNFPHMAYIEDSFYYEATEAIFNNGVFGFDNELNKDNYVKLRLQREKNFKLVNTIRLVFPSYKALCDNSDYAFVKGKPWMLPVAWVYRFVSKIFTKNAGLVMKTIKKPYVISNDSVKERIALLRKWGIDEF